MADSITIQRLVKVNTDLGAGQIQKRIIIDAETDFEYESHESGKLKLANGVTDQALTVTSICVLHAPDYKFTVQVGATDATEITTNHFSYEGSPVTLYLTNPEATADIFIDYVLAN
jgi:hypothetical protein